jgi:hypothetical protein
MALALCAVVLSCKYPDPRGPETAFERLRLAVSAHDARLVYDALDTESRWATDTLWDYQRQIATLVERDFPPELRARELGRVSVALKVSTPRDFFATFTPPSVFHKLGSTTAGLGVFSRLEKTQGQAAFVLTSTGLRIPLRLGPDGAWGYSELHDELVRLRNDVSNDLARTKDNAAVYARAKP